MENAQELHPLHLLLLIQKVQALVTQKFLIVKGLLELLHQQLQELPQEHLL